MSAAAKKMHPATYADLEAVPPNQIAELIAGTLYTFPRPAPKHGSAATSLSVELGGPFQRGRGGPGGWLFIAEPELRFPNPAAKKGFDALSPDIAGWRRERLPVLPKTKYFTLAPDWICEVLSPSTQAYDRATKMPIYAREGVPHAWLLDPLARTLEVFALGADKLWNVLLVHRDEERVRVPPFEALELELGVLWEKAEGDDEPEGD